VTDLYLLATFFLKRFVDTARGIGTGAEKVGYECALGIDGQIVLIAGKDTGCAVQDIRKY
jgi:hypothetical protein